MYSHELNILPKDVKGRPSISTFIVILLGCRINVQLFSIEAMLWAHLVPNTSSGRVICIANLSTYDIIKNPNHGQVFEYSIT